MTQYPMSTNLRIQHLKQVLHDRLHPEDLTLFSEAAADMIAQELVIGYGHLERAMDIMCQDTGRQHKWDHPIDAHSEELKRMDRSVLEPILESALEQRGEEITQI